MASIVVAGAPSVGKATLLRCLQATPCSAATPQVYSVNFETRYYSADLRIQCCTVCTDGTVTPPAELVEVQALVLVIDAASHDSYASVLQLHKQLADHEFDIQLLVANKVDSLQQEQSSSAEHPAWLEDVRTWCYSNGFEYIEAAAGAPSVDAALQDDGEQQGVARVLAALQAHMWPNMVPKPAQHSNRRPAAASSRSASKDQGRDAAAASEEVSATGSASAAEQPSRGSLDAVPTAAPTAQCTAYAAAAADAGQHSNPHAQLSQQQKHLQQAQQQQQQQPAKLDPNLRPAAGAPDEDDPFLDVDVDDFEQLMRQVMGARARLSGLPDDERRAAAADLALKLSALMGLGSDDEDDAGSDDSSGQPAAAAGGDDRRAQLDACK